MIALLCIVGMVVLDQLVKLWSVNTLQTAGTIPIIENVFHLTYVENRGAAFSILQNQIGLFVVFTFAALIIMAVLLRQKRIHTALGRWSLYIVAGGALGNLVDRVVRGYVVDMFDFRLISFPVFNVADIFVSIGAVMLMIYILFQHDQAGKKDD